MNNHINNIEGFKKALKEIGNDPATINAILHYLSETEHPIDYENVYQRITMGEPIQYITGTAYFHRYEFHVSPSTLIPRPETEELCELILAKHCDNSPLHILDIGTGSGCIPLTLLLERSNWSAIALDISQDALEIATKNADKYQINSRIEFIESDILTCTSVPEASVWISNPPYISEIEKTQMSHSVLNYEPHLALFSGENPLIFYEKMSQLFFKNNHAQEFWLELNQYYANEILEIFTDLKLSAKKIEDLSGNPRFLNVLK